MEERFEILSRMVWGVHGDVQRLKMQIAAELGIKGAHVFLIYLLRKYLLLLFPWEFSFVRF